MDLVAAVEPPVEHSLPEDLAAAEALLAAVAQVQPHGEIA
jgi:hypothetical protein